jgi:putative membrane protein
LPVTLVTLGLFLFVINAITLQMTDKIMGDSFEIASFGTAFFVAIIMSIANLIIQKAVFKSEKNE